jgi:hypothetical protein
MASSSASGDSVALPDYAGSLIFIGGELGKTPLLTMSGGLNGGRVVGADIFQMSNILSLNAASSNTVTETASITAPSSVIYAAGQETNFIEIHQTRFTSTWKNEAQIAKIAGAAIAGEGMANVNAVSQRDAHLLQLGVDMEYSMLLGAGTTPATAATDAKMTGIYTGITDNGDETDAASTWLTKAHINAQIAAMLDNGAMFVNPVMMGSAVTIQQINDLYGNPPPNVNVGGVDLNAVTIPLAGTVGLAHSPIITSTVLLIVDMAFVTPVFMVVPGKPGVFFSPLGDIGAAVAEQLFGLLSIDYGSFNYHGAVKGIKQS